MKYKPHPYQQHTTNFILTHKNAAIFLDMGLGKTISTLTALDHLTTNTFETKKTLIIAPLRVARDTWPQEIHKWDHLHLTYSLCLGNEKQRERALSQPANVYIINRENVPWLLKRYTKHTWPFDMVVIDELSSFKSHTSLRFKALKTVRPYISRVVGLTGTPTSNGLMDLWAQYRIIDQGERLGASFTRFRDTYFQPDRWGYQQVYSYAPRPGAEEEIYERIQDITVSMRGGDHLDLPSLVTATTAVTMSPGEYASYRRLERDFLLPYAGEVITAGNAAVLAGKLLQLSQGAVYGENERVLEFHKRKLDALEDIVESANGHPVLVAYMFRHDKDRILKKFPNARLLATQEDMKAWNEKQISIGLLHPASGGHGLNLQEGGHILVWFGIPWSLELYQQMNARLYRQGQTQPVSIIHIVTHGTIDEQIAARLEAKEAIQDSLIEAVKTIITQAVTPHANTGSR